MKVVLYAVMVPLVIVSALLHLAVYTLAVLALAAPTALLLWGSLSFLLDTSQTPSYLEVLAAMYLLNLVRTLVLSGLVKPETAVDRMRSAIPKAEPKV